MRSKSLRGSFPTALHLLLISKTAISRGAPCLWQFYFHLLYSRHFLPAIDLPGHLIWQEVVSDAVVDVGLPGLAQLIPPPDPVHPPVLDEVGAGLVEAEGDLLSTHWRRRSKIQS